MPDELHKVKRFRLSFDGTRPPRVAYIRSPQNLGDEIRKTAFHAHKLNATETHGPRYADLLRRASADHTTHATYTCVASDGTRCTIPVTLIDEDAAPLDVARLL